MKDFITRFMAGRNGIDQLSQALFIGALVMIVAAMFTGIFFFMLVGILLFGYSYYRVFSRNIPARSKENQSYREMTVYWKRRISALRESDKEHKVFICPNKSCSQKIRVPRGKGNIEITCPKCRSKFQKKT